MANPQAEDGHLDIANEIVEALAKTRISGTEMQLLWVIFRKTYGWHKKEDVISLSQFNEMTGLPKPHIVRYLKKLLHKKIIIIAQKDNASVSYQFNKDFEIWEPLPKKITLPKKAINVAQKDNASLPKKIHTKETTTKEKKERKKRSTPMADDQFWLEVKKIYYWIDIDKEIQKMKGYEISPKGRARKWRMTQQRVIEWLNRIDKPMDVKPKIENDYPRAEDVLRRQGFPDDILE